MTKLAEKSIDLLHPPAEWFSKPTELKPGMGTTITDDGHVFGYLALFNARYINGGKGNTKPPRSRSGYTYANSFTTQAVDKGNDIVGVSTGVISGDGGHHHGGSFQATQAAYADTANLLARVKYGEDAHGIWFSGATWPKADDAAIEMLRSTGVSGHWEKPKPGASLELLAACTVNIPGFSQHRLCASATPGGGLILASELEPGPASRTAIDEATHTTHTPMQSGAGLNPFVSGKVIPGGLRVGGGGLTAAGGALQPVSGTLMVLNSPTIDGRTIMDVDWQMLPIPLMYCDEQGWGHMGAKTVGSINEITVDGSIVKFSGFVDSALEHAAEIDILSTLKVLGISVDGYPEGDVSVIWGEDGWPESFVFEKLVLIGATITPLPAFQETRPIMVAAAPEPVVASAELHEAMAEFGVSFAVTDYQDLALADREMEWDGNASEGRVREWAGGEDSMDWEKYRKAFVWYDSDKPEEFGSYKLGIGDIIDGSLKAVPRGIFAVAGVLQGGRGGVDIPENDIEAAKGHIAKYYDKMAKEFEDETITPPWEQATAKDLTGTESGNASAGSQTFATTTIRPPIAWL